LLIILLHEEQRMTHPQRNPEHERKAAQAARERAQQYRQGKQGEEQAGNPPKPKSEAEWRDLVARRIEEAMQQGEFDNLRGQGKPLNLQRNPHVPPGYELAFDLLQNNDLAPGWIMARKDLLRDVEQWRARLRGALAQLQAAPRADAAERRWAAQRQVLEAELEELNERILTVNLQLPAVPSLELLKLRMDEELTRAGLET
jgi:hypothetical protein